MAELTAISDRLQADALPTEPPTVPDADVEEFYKANATQFQIPETRDVRVLLNPDAAATDACRRAAGRTRRICRRLRCSRSRSSDNEAWWPAPLSALARLHGMVRFGRQVVDQVGKCSTRKCMIPSTLTMPVGRPWASTIGRRR